jgi:hypothetical protein
MNPQLATWLMTLIFVPLIGFGLYRRFKSTFGRQRVTPRRMIVRMVLLSAVCAMLVATSPPPPTGMFAAGVGVASGIALAVFGLSLTTFEATPEGKFYVPNGWIGLAVTALVLGRLAARLVEMPARMAAVQAGSAPPDSLQRSPLTLGLFFLLAGYYVAYYAGVLRKARSL